MVDSAFCTPVSQAALTVLSCSFCSQEKLSLGGLGLCSGPHSVSVSWSSAQAACLPGHLINSHMAVVEIFFPDCVLVYLVSSLDFLQIIPTSVLNILHFID